MEGYEPFGSRIFHGCDLGFKCIESIWIMCTRIGTMRTCSAQKLIEDGCVCGKDADLLVQEPSPYSHAVTELHVDVYGNSAIFTECDLRIKHCTTSPSRRLPLEGAWTERSESFQGAAIGSGMDRKVRIYGHINLGTNLEWCQRNHCQQPMYMVRCRAGCHQRRCRSRL
jgi:hypothetical protein